MTTSPLYKSWEYEAVGSYTTVASQYVVSEVIRLFATPVPGTAAQEEPRRRSIMELQGLGRDIWEGIDAGSYIDALRHEWDNR
jgi:hypothetical protein